MTPALDPSPRVPDATLASLAADVPVLFRSTISALLTPRRFVAILVVIVPLLAMQVNYSTDPFALPLAMVMILAFVLVAPTLWRTFFPLAGPRRPPVFALVYGCVGALLVVGIGRGIPWLVGMGYTFLTTRPSLFVSVALFWVGGWGLARDIDLEESYRREKDRAEVLAKEAEHAQLLALKSHLDPHFLFNTLNAIAEWCREDGAVAEAAILQLSQMLRTVMEGIATPTWPLARELELCETVFALHRIRDPELFGYVRDVPSPAPAVDVPPLVLLPVAENAMKHGPARGNRGDVSLTVTERAGKLVIAIENPGDFQGPRRGGQGLRIVERRLRLAFGDAGRFDIRGSARADGTRTTLATLEIDTRALAPEGEP